MHIFLNISEGLSVYNYKRINLFKLSINPWFSFYINYLSDKQINCILKKKIPTYIIIQITYSRRI